MSTIRTRFATLVVAAAVAPLLLYGLVSIVSLRRGTRESVGAGHANIVSQAGARLGQYLDDNVRLLQSVGAALRQPGLTVRQQERALTSFVLDFPEFRDATLYASDGTPLSSSQLLAPPAMDVHVPVDANGLHLSPLSVDEDLLPKTTITMALDGTASSDRWLVGTLSLEELWRSVDRIRVGEHGFALLVDGDGRLIAHGNPNEKGGVARGDVLVAQPLVGRLMRERPEAPLTLEYTSPSGERMLGAGTRLPLVGWIVVLEQPTSEAYAVADRLLTQLITAIGIALVFTLLWSGVSARAFIRPIDALIAGTKRLAAGQLDARVAITGDEEFVRLGGAFNTMADRLAALQAAAVRQERQAMFGKVAAGLAHDLAHPVQNISNNCRLMLRMYDDAEYRATFQRIVEREVGIVRRMLDDLKNLAKPMALERFAVDVNRSLSEVVDALSSEAAEGGVALAFEPAPEGPFIVGDLFALGRVYRNLIVNAIQATAAGGRVIVRAAVWSGRVRIAVEDTGIGIEPERLATIFDDFTTTKRRGLGLGLAIAKKIVEQLDGTIVVTSARESGTTFTLEFPSAPASDTAVAG